MTSWVPGFASAQVRAAERPLLEAGVPLMRFAARELAGVVAAELRSPGATARGEEGDLDRPVAGRLLVLAGGGDNGGDALYAAAELLQRADARDPRGALEVDVLRTSDRVHDQALTTALAAGAHPVSLAEVSARLDGPAAGRYDIAIDGILGIGASADPALRGAARDAVALLLASVRAGRLRVVAADLPSGLQPDAGTTSDELVLPASVTVTFGAVKPGLGRARGPELCGALVLVDFDLPLEGEPAGGADVARVVAGRRDRA